MLWKIIPWPNNTCCNLTFIKINKPSVICNQHSCCPCCCSVVKLCLTLRPHEWQHTRLPCPSLSPRVSPELVFSTCSSQINSYVNLLPKPGSSFTSASKCLKASWKVLRDMHYKCSFIQHQANVYWALSVCPALSLVEGFYVHKHFGFCIFVSKEC